MSNINPKRYQDEQDRSNREAVNVAAVVRVTGFDPAKMAVDVQPLSKRLVGGVYQEQPPILGVPVACMRGGGFILRPWIASGDIGAVIYIDHDIDKVIADGKEADPLTERNHSTSDAVYIGGLVTGNALIGSLPDNAAVLAAEDGRAYIALSDGKIILHGDVTLSGSLDAAGDIKAGAASLKAHVHGGVTPGSAATGQPQ